MPRTIAAFVSVTLLTLAGGCGAFAGSSSSDPGALDAHRDAGAHGDASGNDAGRPRPILVQATANYSSSTSTTLTMLAPSGPGSTLIVTAGFDSKNGVNVAKVTDNVGNKYVRTARRATDTKCTMSTEIWYATTVKKGATSITVENDALGGVDNEAWIMEFSGLSANPLVGEDVASEQPRNTIVTAPQVPVDKAESVVVSIGLVCGNASKIHADNPFINLANVNTEFTAFHITTGPGAFGAIWESDYDTWCAQTAVFY